MDIDNYEQIGGFKPMSISDKQYTKFKKEIETGVFSDLKILDFKEYPGSRRPRSTLKLTGTKIQFGLGTGSTIDQKINSYLRGTNSNKVVLYFYSNQVYTYTKQGRIKMEPSNLEYKENESLTDYINRLKIHISKLNNYNKIYVVIPFTSDTNKRSQYVLEYNPSVLNSEEDIIGNVGKEAEDIYGDPNEGFNDEQIYATVGPIYANVGPHTQAADEVYASPGTPEEAKEIKKGYEYSKKHNGKDLKLIIFDLDETITDAHSVGTFSKLLKQMVEEKGNNHLTTNQYKKLCENVENKIFKPTNLDKLKSILSGFIDEEYELAIVSRGIQQSVLEVLASCDLLEYFPNFVFGADVLGKNESETILGQSESSEDWAVYKVKIIEAIIDQYNKDNTVNIKKPNVLFIDDTILNITYANDKDIPVFGIISPNLYGTNEISPFDGTKNRCKGSKKKVGPPNANEDYIRGVEMLDVLSQLLKKDKKIAEGKKLQNHHELYQHITKAKLDKNGPPPEAKKPIDILNSLYHHTHVNFDGYLESQMTQYSIWKEDLLQRMNYKKCLGFNLTDPVYQNLLEASQTGSPGRGPGRKLGKSRGRGIKSSARPTSEDQRSQPPPVLPPKTSSPTRNDNLANAFRQLSIVPGKAHSQAVNRDSESTTEHTAAEPTKLERKPLTPIQKQPIKGVTEGETSTDVDNLTINIDGKDIPFIKGTQKADREENLKKLYKELPVRGRTQMTPTQIVQKINSLIKEKKEYFPTRIGVVTITKLSLSGESAAGRKLRKRGSKKKRKKASKQKGKTNDNNGNNPPAAKASKKKRKRRTKRRKRKSSNNN